MNVHYRGTRCHLDKLSSALHNASQRYKFSDQPYLLRYKTRLQQNHHMPYCKTINVSKLRQKLRMKDNAHEHAGTGGKRSVLPRPQVVSARIALTKEAGHYMHRQQKYMTTHYTWCYHCHDSACQNGRFGGRVFFATVSLSH